MKSKGSAYTVDVFVPLASKELGLLKEYVWTIVHNLNNEWTDIPVVQDPDIEEIEERLSKIDPNRVISYKPHPDIKTIYTHSQFLPWNMVMFSRSKYGKYEYEILFLN